MLISALIIVFVLITGAPIAVALIVGPLIYVIAHTDLSLLIVPQRMLVACDSFILTALPLFILAGSLMNEGEITPKLVQVAQLLVGRLKGSLAHVTVVVCMFFGGITGAAVAECSAVGSVLIPAMRRDGYSTSFAGGLTASASVMGPIIPPSIPMLVYAMLSDTSVGVLFLAGAVPGVIIGISMMILNYFMVRSPKHYSPKPKPEITTAQEEGLPVRGSALRDGFLVLMMPIIIIGGIVGGIFTATEAAGVAVFYAFFLGFVIFRKLKVSKLPGLLLETGSTTAVVMFIIAASNVLAWILTYEEIPMSVANAFLSFTQSKVVFLLLLIVLLLFVGTFLEPTGGLILLVPIVLPLSKTLGLDPVHFGTVMVIGLVIGLLTPPVGLCLYIGCSLTGLSIERITLACLPFIFLLIGVFLLVAFIPSIALWLPGILMGYQPVGFH